MKLQSKDGAMIVDFYPTQMPNGNVSNEWFLKVLTFANETQSEKLVNRIEMKSQVQKRLDLNYQVLDFNTTPQLVDQFV
jgi:hypothetical protein